MDIIKVLIVDDSKLICSILENIINHDNKLKVVGIANNPFEANNLIAKHNPDVITLDLEMPKMNGVDFLEKMNKFHPIPTIIVSGHTTKTAQSTFKCLSLGAFDVILKPNTTTNSSWESVGELLITEIKSAYQCNLNTLMQTVNHQDDIQINANNQQPIISNGDYDFIAIGTSTGGVSALHALLSQLPKGIPGIVIVQHIPKQFSKSFAESLNSKLHFEVVEGKEGTLIETNKIIIAPGNQHMRIKKKGHQYFCNLLSTYELVNGHMPSVEVLFNSCEPYAKKVISVILTGMGCDGAKAMTSLKKAGSHTIVQDKESSLVWGMPGSVVKLNGACEILPISKIPNSIVNKSSKNKQ
ncbi:MAG: chemotaxis-specific protein-glutamate methyltransferase CheB [Francisellaceae bacterium]|jgi:two-component system, chemotaxis family, protein-glutamate methylesterase/glutaminase|nr:chemotaxis-specific protein-glutamate methyltransferase CheB [Francisellaceae bacterium]